MLLPRQVLMCCGIFCSGIDYLLFSYCRVRYIIATPFHRQPVLRRFISEWNNVSGSRQSHLHGQREQQPSVHASDLLVSTCNKRSMFTQGKLRLQRCSGLSVSITLFFHVANSNTHRYFSPGSACPPITGSTSLTFALTSTDLCATVTTDAPVSATLISYLMS